MRLLLCTLLLFCVATPSLADEPVSPEEAYKRMQERAAVRKKAAETQPAAATPATRPAPKSAPATQPAAPAWNAINDFTYQLQAVDLDAMGKSKFDLAIVDKRRERAKDQS